VKKYTSLTHYTKRPQKYTKWPLNIENGDKIYKHFPFQDPPKYIQIGIFGTKINHLATLTALSTVPENLARGNATFFRFRHRNPRT
jgi:hypothetical protein